MNRKKRSPIWTIPSSEFRAIVVESNSIADIARAFDLVVGGAHYKVIYQRIREEGIDISHIPRGLGNNKGRRFRSRAIPLEEIMVPNSSYGTGHLKKRLLKAGILRNACYICNLGPVWNDKKLVMVLDHINGTRDDHRLENLRLLCPNCNSQQPTFAGGNCKKMTLAGVEPAFAG